MDRACPRSCANVLIGERNPQARKYTKTVAGQRNRIIFFIATTNSFAGTFSLSERPHERSVTDFTVRRQALQAAPCAAAVAAA